jgi:hypothetical protein
MRRLDEVYLILWFAGVCLAVWCSRCVDTRMVRDFMGGNHVDESMSCFWMYRQGGPISLL